MVTWFPKSYVMQQNKAFSPYLLTTYVARHAWASIAKSREIPISVISEALGHTSEATMRLYLKELERMVVEMANRKVPEAVV